MDKKIVRYNGGTKSYYHCSKPTQLVVGKNYEVVSKTVRDFQTDYTLKGVEGHFNSVWFDDVPSTATTFMALARTVPTVGTRYDCFRLNYVDGCPELVSCTTSTVKEVVNLGNNIYRVTTKNSLYIVQVG